MSCLLEEIEPGRWQATPVRKVAIYEVESAYVDVLPGRSSIDFVLEEEDS